MRAWSRALPFLLCGASLLAGGMNGQERERLVRHSEKTRAGFLKSVNGLTAGQLNFRPSPESWTILECAEHITVSEDNMYEEFQEKYMSMDPRSGVKSETPDDSATMGSRRAYPCYRRYTCEATLNSVTLSNRFNSTRRPRR